MQPGSVSDAGAARLRAPTTKLRPRPEGTKRRLSVCWPRLPRGGQRPTRRAATKNTRRGAAHHQPRLPKERRRPGAA